MLESHLLYCLVLFLEILPGHWCACTYPFGADGSNWKDAHQAGEFQLTGSNTQMANYEFTIYGVSVTSWDCYQIYNELVISKATISSIVGNKDIYMCQKFHRYDATTYTYYLMSAKNAEESNAARIYDYSAGSTPNVCEICNDVNNNGPNDNEFIYMTVSSKDPNSVDLSSDPQASTYLTVGCHPCRTTCTSSNGNTGTSDSSSSDLSTGAIVGIVFGVLAFVFLVSLIIVVVSILSVLSVIFVLLTVFYSKHARV